MIHDEQIQKQVLVFVTLLPHLCVFFYCDAAALQYGRRSHFRAQGLGRPSSSRPNFFVLVLPRPIMLQETI